VVFYLSQRNLLLQQRGAEVLAEQRERLRTTLASIGDAVISTDTEGCITNMNAVAESLTGWKLEEAIGHQLDTVFRIVNEETRQPVHNPATKAMREGVIVGLANHTVLIAKGGAELPIDDSAAPIRDGQGQVVGCVLVFRDMTERRRAEASLREQTELLDLDHDAIIVRSTEGVITFWSHGAEQMYGWPKEAALGKVTYTLLRTEFPRPLPEIETELAERSWWEGTLTHTKKNGSRIVVASRWAMRKGNRGKTSIVLEINRDITDRKQAEQAMADARAYAESIVDTVREPLLVLDGKLRVKSASHSFCQTFSVSP